MKKLLILIVFGAVFLHYFPQPELETWYEDKKSYVLDEVSKATDTQIRLSVKKVMDEIAPKIEHLNEEQQDYIKEVTSDRASVNDFFIENCKEGSKNNEMLTKANVAQVCQVMGKYQSLM